MSNARFIYAVAFAAARVGSGPTPWSMKHVPGHPANRRRRPIGSAWRNMFATSSNAFCTVASRVK